MATAGLFDALFCISQQRFVQKRAFEPVRPAARNKGMAFSASAPAIWEARSARQRGAKEKRNFCSSASRNSFLSRPPPYPVSRPSAPITRWQGMTMAMGFLWFAEPTARAACGAPILSAICP